MEKKDGERMGLFKSVEPKMCGIFSFGVGFLFMAY